MGIALAVNTHLALDVGEFTAGAESLWGRAEAHGPHASTRSFLLHDCDDDDTGSNVAEWQKAD